jgi:hypothetical protein
MKTHVKQRYEHNIKMDLTVMDWILVAEDRDRCLAVVNTEINFRVPLRARNFRTR